jgi:hypothetical protein
VSCTAARACIAVGTEPLSSDGPDAPLALRWDGRRWKTQRTPQDEANDESFDDVWCVSSADCTAVGALYAKRAPLTAHWDGRRWSLEPVRGPAARAVRGLQGVWCAAPTTCLGVGSLTDPDGAVRALVERRAGGSWHRQRLSTPTGAAAGSLDAVSCRSDSACMAVGTGLAQRWTGSRWATAPANRASLGVRLLGVSCDPSGACTAVGWSDQQAGPMTIAERWDGRRWVVQTSPRLHGQLRSVSCPSPALCVAVGYADFGTGTAPAIARWDGAAWVVQALASEPGGELEGVSCPSTIACVAVGSNAGGPVAALWDGSTWTVQSTPAPGAGGTSDLTAVSCASAAACTAVGSCAGAVCSPTGSQAPLAERWDGTLWSIERTPDLPGTDDRLNSVSCLAPSACTAVGLAVESSPGAGRTEALIERWDGTAWKTEASAAVGPLGRGLSAADLSLDGVSCAAAACTAVGSFTSDDPVQLIERRRQRQAAMTRPSQLPLSHIRRSKPVSAARRGAAEADGTTQSTPPSRPSPRLSAAATAAGGCRWWPCQPSER